MNDSRKHLMQCLAREVGSWSAAYQHRWLVERFAKEHSAELTEWLRVNANRHRVSRIEPDRDPIK